MNKIKAWLAHYNKAFVPVVMVGVYLINKNYGVALPINSTEVEMIIYALLTAAGVFAVPNGKKPE